MKRHQSPRLKNCSSGVPTVISVTLLDNGRSAGAIQRIDGDTRPAEVKRKAAPTSAISSARPND